jgi:two-component system nitrogen regulation response regulator GlnG
MAHLLIVDDEPSICWALGNLAEKTGHSAAIASSGEQALAEAERRRPDVVMLDVRLPGIDGIATMGRMHDLHADVPVVMMTAFGELTVAVDAMRGGAFEYLVKPFDLQVARKTIERALRSSADQAGRGADDGESPGSRQAMIVGKSPPMQEVFKRIALVAESNACVFLHGEQGTGKELVARAIHQYSPRADRPFVSINVGSLAGEAADVELFGQAPRQGDSATVRVGALERADGGTIFIGDAAEMPVGVQAKLLAAIESGEIWPVGADQAKQIDVRVVSASHRGLAESAATGQIRHDLFLALTVFSIELPPLSERGDDVHLLAEFFVSQMARVNDDPRASISREAMAKLAARPWHGNVGELRGAIQHAMILARGGVISPEHLPLAAPPGVDGSAQPQSIGQTVRQWAKARFCEEPPAPDAGDLYERFLAAFEPPFLEEALENCGGQCAAAARRLGLHRATLKKKLDQYGIE